MNTMDSHANKILIAIDDSKTTEHAMHQVTQRIGPNPRVQILLLHVAGPIPPKLLEFGGSEDPEEEAQREAQLRAAQAQWWQQVEQAAQPIFAKARAILRPARLPDEAIETRTYPLLPGQDLGTVILAAAQSTACDTVVLGRSSFTWWQALSQQHVADTLEQANHEFTLWIVDDEKA